ncbi:MAG: iron chelate uptake ABC transporter family permease subunit [Lachnospiraceae bacterium]
MDASVVMNIRLPRTILALLVGAGLATTGAAYQGLFQNPLVSPDVLGTSAGAAFGAVLGILLSGMDYRAMALSVVFGLLSVVLVFLLSMLSGQTTVISLVLSGMIVQALMNALISLSKYVADPTEKLPAITYWLMGSFISANYSLLKLVTIPILLGIAVIFALRWRINVLSMGDEECISLGIDP